MSKRPRRNHSPAFKAKVALDAIRGDKTLAAQILGIAPRTIYRKLDRDEAGRLVERPGAATEDPD